MNALTKLRKLPIILLLLTGLSSVFLWPFYTLTQNPSSGGVVLELSSVIAMIVYLLLAWVFVELLWLLLGRERA